ncbi:hypothetical protein HanIR_Chr07g0301401 [Helianthus annuus]|nr:hypothetical protein HanIR_Chr07g0301401 [Helianthus annuus]
MRKRGIELYGRENYTLPVTTYETNMSFGLFSINNRHKNIWVLNICNSTDTFNLSYNRRHR